MNMQLILRDITPIKEDIFKVPRESLRSDTKTAKSYTGQMHLEPRENT